MSLTEESKALGPALVPAGEDSHSEARELSFFFFFFVAIPGLQQSLVSCAGAAGWRLSSTLAWEFC